MISGVKGRASIPLLLALAAIPASAAAPLTVTELMQMLGSVESARARFVETRESTLLKTPLVLQGTLSYRRPDRVEKHVLSPRDERITVEGGNLTLENRSQNRRKTISVGSAPGLAALVESIRATRAGDLVALRRHYALRIEGSRGEWTLTLTPLDSQVGDYVTSVVLSGSDSRIGRIAVVETGGDRSVMEITEMSVGERAPSGQSSRSLPVPSAPPATGNPDAPVR
jgi:outer membrane lipoprotein-sorting protein